MRHRGFGYITIVVLLLAYFVFTIVMVVLRRDDLPVAALKVVVLDSAEVRFLNKTSIERLVQDSVLSSVSKIEDVDLERIESLLESNLYVQDVVVASNMEGEVVVTLSQRYPEFRVVTQNGYNFYVDSTLRVLKPVAGYYPNVIILTGELNFGFGVDFFGDIDEKKDNNDVENLKKLSNFVGNINNDSYLGDLISQIYLKNGGGGEIEVEIIPSVGRALVLFGGLDMAEKKLQKLSYLYRRAYSYAGLDTAREVDVRFSNQILTR